MQKIISLFQRNYETDRLVRDEVTSGAGWVINGEGIATRKWDGTCCLILKGQLFKRYDVKKGKTPPAGFIPAQEPDPVTGHWPGWIAIPADDKKASQLFPLIGDVKKKIGYKIGATAYATKLQETQQEKAEAVDLLRRLRNITTWLDMPDTSAELRNRIDTFLK